MLSSAEIAGSYLPTTTVIDITGVQPLLICCKKFGSENGRGPIYIFNATIE